MRRVLSLIAIAFLAGCASAPASGPAPGTGTGSATGSTTGPREVQGERTVTTVREDFDHGPPTLQFSQRIDRWGDRIGDARGSVEIVEAGPGGSGKAARFGFSASLDEPYSTGRWIDSGLTFIARIDLDRPASGSEGVSLRLKPEGFTLLELILVQEGPADTRTYWLSLFANDGEWKEWKVPFSAFALDKSSPPLDLARPFSIEVNVPYQENWHAFHFRTGAEAQCALLVDDVGFWKPRGQDEGRVLEGFDDERDRMPFTLDLYGSSVWVDYSASDQGETKLNEGVKGQQLRLSRKPGGPEGSFLALEGRLELDPAIALYHQAGQSLTVFLKAPFGRPIAGAHGLSFLVRSDLLRAGFLEVQDEENDRYYGAGFTLIGAWTRVAIPFERLSAGDQSLADAERISGRPRLMLAFDLPPDEVERAAASGVLEFLIALDGFALEP